MKKLLIPVLIFLFYGCNDYRATEKTVIYEQEEPIMEEPILYGDTLIYVPISDLYDSDLWWKVENGKWGILNAQKEPIVACLYDLPYLTNGISIFDNVVRDCNYTIPNPIIFCYSKEESVLVDLKNGVISPSDCKIVSNGGLFNSDYTFQLNNGNYGFMNKTGSIVFPAISSIIPYLTYDSLVLLRENNAYFLTDKQGNIMVGAKEMNSNHFKKILYKMYLDGDLPEDVELDIPHLQSNQHDEILMSVLAVILPDSTNLSKYILDFRFENQHLWNSYCDVDACILQVESELGTDWDDPCWPEGYGSFEKIIYYVNSINPNLFEIEFNAISYGNSHGQSSCFSYYRLVNDSMVEVKSDDWFINTSDLDYALYTYWIENNEDQIGKTIDTTSNIIGLDEDDAISINANGITCWLWYWDYGAYQDTITVPFNYLEDFIPKEGLINDIIKSNYIRKSKY